MRASPRPALTGIALAAMVLLTLAACSKDADTRTTPAENRVAAKAVADVDAAMIDGRKAPVVAAVPVVGVPTAGPEVDPAAAGPAV